MAEGHTEPKPGHAPLAAIEILGDDRGVRGVSLKGGGGWLRTALVLQLCRLLVRKESDYIKRAFAR